MIFDASICTRVQVLLMPAVVNCGCARLLIKWGRYMFAGVLRDNDKYRDECDNKVKVSVDGCLFVIGGRLHATAAGGGTGGIP